MQLTYIRLFVVFTMISILPLTLNAQITITGIEGLNFSKTDSDYSLSITDNFTLHGMQVQPNGLTLLWDQSEQKFSMYGSIQLTVEEDNLILGLGTSVNPGIVISNDALQSVNFDVNTDFSLKGITFSVKDADFYWQKSSDEYLMSGSFTIDVESDMVEVILGSSEHPGLVIKNNLVTKLEMGVSADFEMKGLSLEVQDMGITWYRESGNSFYGFYGTVNLNIEGQSISANFGDSNHPHILIRSGSVTEVYVIINSDFKVGNMHVEAEDLSVQYEDEKYYVKGTMTITDVFTLIVDLGEGVNSGIEVDVSGSQDSFVLESLVITLDNANLGSIDIKQIQLSFTDNSLADAKIKVSFPAGWDVDGNITFTTGDQATISGVTISFETDNIEDAIEIPGTGLAVVSISGNVEDVHSPSKIHFRGSVGLAFGGPFSLDGYDLTFFYMESDLSITARALYVETDIDLGAYKHDGDWHSLLGDGNLDIGLIWNDDYTLNGTFNVPTDPMIEANLIADISENKSLDALLDVEFIVPSWVPYIHGKHYASVDGALRYLNGHATDSYAAGWVKWDLILTDVYVGAKYNFGTKDASEIGHSSIDDIKDEIEGGLVAGNSNSLNKTTNDYVQLVKSFILEPKAPAFVRVGLEWDTLIDTAYVTVMGPGGIMTLTSLLVTDDGDSTSIPNMETSENLSFVNSGTAIDFIILPSSSFKVDKSIEQAPLLPGQYKVFFSYNSKNGIIDSLEIKASKHHPMATGSITANEAGDGSINLDLEYWAYHPDSTLISIYINDSTGYSGKLIDHLPYGAMADDASGSAVYNYVPANMNTGTETYYYFVIDDGINVPFYSNFTQQINYTPPLYGNVILVDSTGISDSLSVPFMVYIDENGNGSYDYGTTGKLEPGCVTSIDGSFEFHRFETGSHTINIVLPSGFILDADSPDIIPYTFDYNGTPQQANFIIKKEN